MAAIFAMAGGIESLDAAGAAGAGSSAAPPLVISSTDGNIAASISQHAGATAQIRVPLGTSMIVDLNVPVKRSQVTNPEVAVITVLTPRQLLISGQAVGTTQLIIWDEKENRLTTNVTVEPNLAQLKAAIAMVVPDARIDVQPLGDSVLLTGAVANVDQADRVANLASLVTANVLNQISVAGEQQVVLRCTVAEVSKSAVRELSVDAWASFESNDPSVSAAELVLLPGLVNPPGLPDVTGTAFYGTNFLFGSSSHGWQAAIASQSLHMELFVNAMKQNGLLRVLAEPNLVALSGQPAEFLAGGQIPFPVPQATGGGQTITIQWKDFGVLLRFVPTVIGQSRVRLTVAPEISELDYSDALQIEGFLVPAISQRRVNTTIEVATGTTVAIAGLLSEEVRGATESVPYLGDVPILGSLFRSVEYQRDLTELIVLVTPELASGMYPDQVAPVPGQNMTHPNDYELFAEGKLEGEPLVEPESRDDALLDELAPSYRKFRAPPDEMSLHGPWGPAEEVECDAEE